MRELTGHVVNPANDRLRVLVLDPVGPGGAHHLYLIEGFVATEGNNRALNYHPSGGPGTLTGASLLFQNGPINEVGVNGITHEALLAILIDRLECFQRGPYANEYNAKALQGLLDAQGALLERTRARMAQGIEGTMAVGKESDGLNRQIDRAKDAMTSTKSGNPIMKYFTYGHLPPALRGTSEKCAELAKDMEATLPNGAEKSAGLRKLLEAKDCFVRAVVP